jgi:hypothetical protein
MSVYFLVGVAFGATAYLAKSIVPAFPVHIIGDLTFLMFVWPQDAARRLVWGRRSGRMVRDSRRADRRLCSSRDSLIPETVKSLQEFAGRVGCKLN